MWRAASSQDHLPGPGRNALRQTSPDAACIGRRVWVRSGPWPVNLPSPRLPPRHASLLAPPPPSPCFLLPPPAAFSPPAPSPPPCLPSTGRAAHADHVVSFSPFPGLHRPATTSSLPRSPPAQWAGTLARLRTLRKRSRTPPRPVALILRCACEGRRGRCRSSCPW